MKCPAPNPHVRVARREPRPTARRSAAEERQGALVGMLRRGDALATAISRGAGASGVLRVHVNTLRNRLAKIAELTGRDTARTAGRVDLFLALRAADMS